ncbi:hypothetical protein B0J14DRAFT_588358 [Halenospora varia]|nr:hypothetical protein B0J14DRAFT_588358 [Halenospora varia]
MAPVADYFTVTQAGPSKRRRLTLELTRANEPDRQEFQRQKDGARGQEKHVEANGDGVFEDEIDMNDAQDVFPVNEQIQKSDRKTRIIKMKSRAGVYDSYSYLGKLAGNDMLEYNNMPPNSEREMLDLPGVKQMARCLFTYAAYNRGYRRRNAMVSRNAAVNLGASIFKLTSSILPTPLLKRMDLPGSNQIAPTFHAYAKYTRGLRQPDEVTARDLAANVTSGQTKPGSKRVADNSDLVQVDGSSVSPEANAEQKSDEISPCQQMYAAHNRGYRWRHAMMVRNVTANPGASMFKSELEIVGGEELKMEEMIVSTQLEELSPCQQAYAAYNRGYNRRRAMMVRNAVANLGASIFDLCAYRGGGD